MSNHPAPDLRKPRPARDYGSDHRQSFGTLEPHSDQIFGGPYGVLLGTQSTVIYGVASDSANSSPWPAQKAGGELV